MEASTPFGEGGEADQVDEQDRDETALSAGGGVPGGSRGVRRGGGRLDAGLSDEPQLTQKTWLGSAAAPQPTQTRARRNPQSGQDLAADGMLWLEPGQIIVANRSILFGLILPGRQFPHRWRILRWRR
jgi:hypothetical protein